MERVRGIGGVFFKSRDPKALGAWYQEHLGVPLEEWGGAAFRWAEHDRGGVGTGWTPFCPATGYFAPSDSSFMVNFRVDHLDRMLAQLRAAGVKVDDKIDDSEFGRFGCAVDRAGNKIELWAQ